MDGETTQEGVIKYQGVVLDRPGGRRSDIVQHDPKSYMRYYLDNAFSNMVEDVQKYLKTRFDAYDSDETLSLMTRIFYYKVWPSSFKGSPELRRWGVSDVEALAKKMEEGGYLSKEEEANVLLQWSLFRVKVKNVSKEKGW